MARRRFQSPKPFREGQFWWLPVRDTNPAGNRKRQLAPADMPVREVQKIAEDKLRPVNQELALTGSVLHFSEFMISTYVPTYLPLLSAVRGARIKGILAKYLEPRFGRLCLRDLTQLTVQQYFSSMAGKAPHRNTRSSNGS
jgi:hypothetical protein